MRPRVIPTLLLLGEDLVKTRSFANPIYVGDPINTVRIFNEKEVDEILVIDIGATSRRSEVNYTQLQSLAEEAFMPLTYCGGIRSLDDARRVFDLGIEKVALDSLLHRNPLEVWDISNCYGKQAVAGLVTVVENSSGYFAQVDGKSVTPFDSHVQSSLNAGIGELIVYSRNLDGQRTGYDLGLISRARGLTDIPIVACGGAGTIAHLRAALDAGASAVAAGSKFVFYESGDSVLISYLDQNDFENLAM